VSRDATLARPRAAYGGAVAAGVTGAEGAEFKLLPTLFVARTVNV
jgi:hypothetical protein